ncbi:Cyclic nucleotide-binding domain-containing protein [Sulfidibacter corallicola]|uniref:Cyclic nucleotide-binding domain-containing protein n=1 Tax=Sulfidibacter corallicola TaxID=2818388 RepID=A0A8A4TXW1_SULCO|nr:cyclic nucleotide-binding domain-containing protein [Sulfidibacter corallicola]QTD53934.1 cyclic nucleotide-binding domain-containing protein [Sulfidibacter corallicola]
MSSGNFFAQYTVEYDPGEVIYKEDEPGNCMFVIKSGTVDLSKNANDTSETISELSKGDFFGELSILEHSPRMETAKAKDKVSVVVIHRGTFVKMLKANMEIAIRMLQKLSTKLRLSEEKVDELFIRVSRMQSEALLTQPNIRVNKEKKVAGKLISLSSNRVFILNSDRNLVGRYDPVTGIKPEVDLTYEDDNRSVSRRHAIIFRRNNQFFVQEEIGVLNGTYVNGTKATNGGEHPVKDQDMVNFGMLAFKFYVVDEDSLPQ